MSGMRKKRKLRARDELAGDTAAVPVSPEMEVGPGEESEFPRASVDFAAIDADEAEGAAPLPVDQSDDALLALVESLLFATDKPLTVLRLRQLSGERSTARIQGAIDQLMTHYRDRGIVLHFVAGAYQFRTHPRCSQWVQSLIAGRPVRMSRAQLETLAIVAYRQPITRPEIDDIRGVDSGATLKLLSDRSLVRVLGKKEEPGRPLLYGTTKEFLEFFNMNELRDLPTLREYHELSEDSLRVVHGLGFALDEAS